MDKDFLSKIPSVNVLLQSEMGLRLIANYSHEVVVDAIRNITDKLRTGELGIVAHDEIHQTLLKHVTTLLAAKFAPSLKRCINATGTVIHTNLGRAKLSPAVARELTNVACFFSNLEYDVESGSRGSRYQHLEQILCDLTGAEDALVVNNNAAAVMLVLDTIKKKTNETISNQEVIVSRGELVEIGGSFRIPEIIELSGCRLREVGTTNKTHLYDYENACKSNTIAILKVHTSNFKISGFTKSIEIPELATISQGNEVPLIHDMGSGMLIDLQKYGLPYEMTVKQSLVAGSDIVTFSGDKVLGGPQAGIIVGKKKYLNLMKKNQLARALRVDKMTIATLEATLRFYYDEHSAIKKISTLQMLTIGLDELKEKALELLRQLNYLQDVARTEIIDSYSQVGGGAYPNEEMKSYAVAISPKLMNVNELTAKLRQFHIPIICKIRNNRCEFDVRTIEYSEFPELIIALNESLLKN